MKPLLPFPLIALAFMLPMTLAPVDEGHARDRYERARDHRQEVRRDIRRTRRAYAAGAADANRYRSRRDYDDYREYRERQDRRERNRDAARTAIGIGAAAAIVGAAVRAIDD